MSEIITAPHSLEAEQSVIGGILLDYQSDRAQKALAMLKPESFYSRPHQVIFTTMKTMARESVPIDGLTVHDRLERDNLLGQMGGFSYLGQITKDTVSQANIIGYASVVREKAMERYGIQKLNEATEMFYARNGMTAAEKFDALQGLTTQIADYAKTGNRRGLRSFGEVMDDWVVDLEKRFDPSGEQRGLSSGIPSLDRMLAPKGLVKGSLFVIGARPKMGKAQPLDSRILLANGKWTTFRDVQEGDMLASADSEPSYVTGVFPQGERQIYTVKFSDGRVVKCADDHLWEIHCSKMPNGSGVVDTERLREMLLCVRYQNRIHVPGIEGHFGGKVDLGISPWLLGALLGDGSMLASVNISMTESYICERVSAELPKGVRLRHIKNGDYSLVGGHGIVSGALRKLGLIGCRSERKFIPEVVFTANRETRIAVLCGLLETDGWVQGENCLAFSTSSPELFDGIQRLIHSLGGVCRRTCKPAPKYTHNGEKRVGLPAHVGAIRLSDEIRGHIISPRLQNRSGARRVKTSEPVIVSVEPAGREECVCIMVSHPRHLYATDGCILTHNTTLYSQMAINCAIREKKPALMFSLEMPSDQILEKLVGQKSGVNPSIFYMPATDDVDDTYQGNYDEDFGKAIATANRLREEELLFIDDTPGLSLAHIVAESRKIKRQKGFVGMILVDYLTLMTAEKADRNDLAYGMITKGLKNLAKELGCVVVLLTQLNRELEKRPNKRPLPSDSRDTGQIEQDCDYWVGIHREGAFDESVPAGETELILRLNRHGNTGTVFCLQQNGAIYDMDQTAARNERDSRQQSGSKKGGF